MLCAINVNRAVELEFSLQVQGTTAKSIEPRFIIIGPEYAITCFCVPEQDKIKVKVPKLEGILPLGTHEVRFEVLLGDQLCVAMKDQIELKGKSKLDQTEEAKPTITVSFASPAPKKEKKEKKVVEAIEHHHEVHLDPVEPTAEVEEAVQLIEQVQEPIVEEVVAITPSLMQQVQAYRAPHPEFNVTEYIANKVAQSIPDGDRAGFSLIKKLSK